MFRFEEFRKSQDADFGRHIEIVEGCGKQSEDPHLRAQQLMLTTFNRLKLGMSTIESPEIQQAMLEMEELNVDLELMEIKAVLTAIRAMSHVTTCVDHKTLLDTSLEHCRASGNRLYQIYALGLLATREVYKYRPNIALEHLEEATQLAKEHKSPLLYLDGLSNQAALYDQIGDNKSAINVINKAMDLHNKELNQTARSECLRFASWS